MMRSGLLLAAAIASPVAAQTTSELREFCGDRPGIGIPACTVDRGHIQVEVGLGDWTRDTQPDARTDTILAGDVSLRYGVTDTTELRFGWTAYGHVRTRDRQSGMIDRASGIGDVTFGLKQNLRNPAGDGLSIALLPFATAPTGHRDVGAGTWSGGMLAPITYALSDRLTLELTPEMDAAADADGGGRHLAYSGVVGLQAKLSEKISAAAELKALRDRDPAEKTSQALAGLSFAFQPREQVQLDFGANAGLSRHAPDIELYLGVSRKF